MGGNSPMRRGRTQARGQSQGSRARSTARCRSLPKPTLWLKVFRPGVIERLGLGPDRLLKLNPRIVIARLTGYGQTGPLADSPGHDPNYIALSGALYSIGPNGGPPIQPMNLLGDFASGSLYAVVGMLAALRHAEKTGRGQVVDASIVDGAASLMTGVFGGLAAGTWTEGRSANLTDGGSYLTVYETADKKHVVIGSLEPQFYAAIVKGLGLDIVKLPPREDRANWPILRKTFADIFRTKTRDEWVTLLEGSDACLAGILTPTEALTLYPHNVARQTLLSTTRATRRRRQRHASAPRPQAVSPPIRGDDSDAQGIGGL